MNAKDKWIEETLHEVEKLRNHSVPVGLNEKIMDRVFLSGIKELKPQVKWTMAAALLVLVTINVALLFRFKTQQTEPKFEQSLYRNVFDYTVQF